MLADRELLQAAEERGLPCGELAAGNGGKDLQAAADIVKHLKNRNGVASTCRTTCSSYDDAACYAFLSIQL